MISSQDGTGARLPRPPAARRPGEATVTPLQPRFSSASAPGGRQARRVAEAPPRRTEAVPPAERAPDPEPPAAPELHQPPAAAEEESHRQADPDPAPAATQAGRRAAGGRGRRAPVPSWDEIMFGSSRPRD